MDNKNYAFIAVPNLENLHCNKTDSGRVPAKSEDRPGKQASKKRQIKK